MLTERVVRNPYEITQSSRRRMATTVAGNIVRHTTHVDDGPLHPPRLLSANEFRPTVYGTEMRGPKFRK